MVCRNMPATSAHNGSLAGRLCDQRAVVAVARYERIGPLSNFAGHIVVFAGCV